MLIAAIHLYVASPVPLGDHKSLSDEKKELYPEASGIPGHTGPRPPCNPESVHC
ncbi:hypothetical protein PTTG_25724 [Puccinia triticina 1-1 BBBD Race 1]|uniref:Uncharacterized protein n=2 Tax=Puccinia triticina TaxID=208348 RepID=A0A180GZW2_PUCT1|nr:uncharacterized protein PtA15_8A398 [Puccinia triticina]OAV98270.1 hypothetical protein PTTG_25724 [Puccinia triticina 1-1 BBBD Race 1]WAQ87494.1 hypothetical protein PtA15_8A398 [Puccinia triticina]